MDSVAQNGGGNRVARRSSPLVRAEPASQFKVPFASQEELVENDPAAAIDVLR
jgi:hypothetical protein